jgi:redox-sensitive bicupin YhaK (pirin superfamily)
MGAGTVSITLRLEKMERGAQFRADILRDQDRTGAMDPVLGVDHAFMAGPTFPPHPHKGFSAVSYVFADAGTGLNNRDSIGTVNLIRPGGLHWTAAGSGIVHEEVPADAGKVSHLLQIFVALPRVREMASPFAVSLEPEDVPVIDTEGVHIRVPLGQYGDISSPLGTPTQLNLFDIRLNRDAELSVPIAAGQNCFIIPIKGSVAVNGVHHEAGGGAIPAFLASASEQTLTLAATDGEAQAVVFSGSPIASQH